MAKMMHLRSTRTVEKVSARAPCIIPKNFALYMNLARTGLQAR